MLYNFDVCGNPHNYIYNAIYFCMTESNGVFTQIFPEIIFSMRNFK